MPSATQGIKIEFTIGRPSAQLQEIFHVYFGQANALIKDGFTIELFVVEVGNVVGLEKITTEKQEAILKKDFSRGGSERKRLLSRIILSSMRRKLAVAEILFAKTGSRNRAHIEGWQESAKDRTIVFI
jgi:hypothetical protein